MATYAESPQTEQDCFFRVLGYLGAADISDAQKTALRQGLTRAIAAFKKEINQTEMSFSDLIGSLSIIQAAALGVKQKAIAEVLWQKQNQSAKMISDYYMLIAIALLQKGRSSR